MCWVPRGTPALLGRPCQVPTPGRLGEPQAWDQATRDDPTLLPGLPKPPDATDTRPVAAGGTALPLDATGTGAVCAVAGLPRRGSDSPAQLTLTTACGAAQMVTTLETHAVHAPWCNLRMAHPHRIR